MKSNILTISTFVTGTAAIALVPFSATIAALAFTAAGVLSVFLTDYGRTVRPFHPVAQVVPFHSEQRSAAVLTEAA